jgi:hypothetical protein
MAFDGAAPAVDLGDLLIDIELGKVAVVVGRALLAMDDGAPLYQRMAAEIAGELGVGAGELPARPEIEDVAERYFSRPFPPNCSAGSLAEKLRNRLRKAAIPRPLQDLAAVGPLGLFLATTPDDLLQRALAAERRAPVQSFTFAPASLDTVPAAALRDGSTVVCRLFGRADDPQQLALTEEDVLEHVRDLALKLDTERGTQHDLAQVLRGRQLLFVGCDFPDWLMRFFIRALRGRRFDPRLFPSARIAGGRVEGGSPLVLFLRRNGDLVYDLPPARFAAELRRQWEEKLHAPAPPRRAPVMSGPSPLVFLTHGPEEDALVDPIAERLARWNVGSVRVRSPGDDLGPIREAQACAVCLAADPPAELLPRLAEERRAIEERAFADKHLSLILRGWGNRSPSWGQGGNLITKPSADEAARRIVEPLLKHKVLDAELPVRLYVAASSSAPDAPHLTRLLQYAGALKSWLCVWSPRQVGAGVEPAAERARQRAAAHVIVLLVSLDLISGEEAEIEAAMERHRSGTALVVPLLVRSTDWESSDLGALTPIPADGLALAEQTSSDKAWTDAMQTLTLAIFDHVLGGAEG